MAQGNSWVIQKDEGTAGLRTIAFQLTTSNLTTPLTTAPTSSTSSIWLSINGAAQIAAGAPISTVSANAGMYSCVLPTSSVSVLGNHAVWWVGGYPQYVGSLNVVNDNVYSSFSNFASVDYSSKFTVGVGIAAPSLVTVRLSAMDYSSVVTTGVGKILAGTYSGVTVGAGDYAAKDMSSALTVGAGIATPSKVTVQLQSLDYSSLVTVGVGNIKAADYSSVVTVGVGIATPSKVSVQVSANNDKTGYTIAAGAYSTVTFDSRQVATVLDKTGYTAATVSDKAGYSLAAADYSSSVTVGIGTIKAATYSGVTVGAGDYASKDLSSKLTVGLGVSAITVNANTVSLNAGVIQAATFGVGAIDAAALATDAGQEIADRVLLRGIVTGTDTGRTVQDAVRALRNRNDIEGGVLTVYQENDTTSAWTAAVTTAPGNPITQIDPA